ncbi:unnamed protein product [Soboliphyme baturini]|uniref:Uncharacterized protein n=1 Tax=Soboliphyme baturini TaxID=241478 RepID=A0A183IWX2_9BILA|nr:unnamed protein product [Soboliphyme baturini]
MLRFFALLLLVGYLEARTIGDTIEGGTSDTMDESQSIKVNVGPGGGLLNLKQPGCTTCVEGQPIPYRSGNLFKYQSNSLCQYLYHSLFRCPFNSLFQCPSYSLFRCLFNSLSQCPSYSLFLSHNLFLSLNLFLSHNLFLLHNLFPLYNLFQLQLDQDRSWHLHAQLVAVIKVRLWR